LHRNTKVSQLFRKTILKITNDNCIENLKLFFQKKIFLKKFLKIGTVGKFLFILGYLLNVL